MAIRVSLSHPLHYIDQNGVHRKLYGSQDRFYFQAYSDPALAGMLRIGDLYFPNASPYYFAYYGQHVVNNDQGTRFTDYDVSYPVPQTIRGSTQQWGPLPAKVLSIGLRLFFNFSFGSGSLDGSAIHWNICRVQGINSQNDTGDISVDKDITLTFEFYSFNPDDMPGQTPQGSYSITIPAGTSEINDYHTQFLNFSWRYAKRTVTIDGVGTFTFPVAQTPWNDASTVRAYKIHLGG